MFSLKAEQRDKDKENNDELRKAGFLPAVLYGEGIKNNLNLKVQEKDFLRVFKEAGESSLIELEAGSQKKEVLIHDVSYHPVSDKILHIDFFHPSEKKKIEAEVPLIFEGASMAEKDLGGVLVRELSEVMVKGLARNLPRELKVDISGLKTFEDKVLVGDLKLPEGVETLREKDEIIAHVTAPRKIEEEKPKEEEKEEEKVEEGEEKPEEKPAKQTPKKQ